jgi:hypothetical protein
MGLTGGVLEEAIQEAGVNAVLQPNQMLSQKGGDFVQVIQFRKIGDFRSECVGCNPCNAWFSF